MFIIDIPSWLSTSFMFSITVLTVLVTTLIASFVFYVIREQILNNK